MLTTDDLFLGGFALTRGGEIAGIEVRGTNGRRVAIFRIEGPDVLAAERGELRRLRGIGARGRRPVHVGHRHAEPLEIGGKALEPDIDHPRPAREDLARRGHGELSVKSALITRSGPVMHAAARAAWALDGSTQAPARSSRAI